MARKITVDWLKKWRSCQDGINDLKESGLSDTKDIIHALIKAERFNDAQWLITRAMPTKKMRVQYAIYCAEQCIKNYEAKFHCDKRPRQAIQAAKRFIKKPTQKNKSAAWSAASAASAARSAESATESAAWSAAWSAASTAWSAARSAEGAAESAAWSAEGAAESAARSAAESAAWSAEGEKMLNYGLKLIYK